MDGATKFVRGDAIAGIIITLVNIVGGLIIGMVQMGMGFGEASETFVTLTVGDGLVSQVPALIISTSAGLIVTRTATEENLGADLSRQLTRYPRALAIAALLLVLFGLVPGMPFFPFLGVGALCGLLAWQVRRTVLQQEAQELAEAEAERERAPAEPERTEDYLAVDPLKVELGYGLIALADPKQGGDLLTRVQIIRQQMATRMGFIVPVVRIVDNMRMRPNEYQIKLREAVVAQYDLMPDHYLAMNPGLVEEEVQGIPTVEPAFGLQALWVARANRDRAERLGYTIVEPSAVLATHLTEVIMNHAHELLTRQDVQALVDNIRETAGSVVEELLPNVLTLGEVQKVLQNLLRERVSIRNLEVVLETLADYGPRTRDIEILTEYCRHALARQICAEYSDEDGVLRVVTLSPTLDQEILNAVRQAETGEYIPLPPERADAIAQAAVQAIQPLVLGGHDPIVLTSAQVRRYVKRIIERQVPRVIVLSYNEIDPAVRLESEGQVEA
jgi:flagellar biosynthesis protein FlhA